MSKTKVAIIVTNIDKSLGYEWLIREINTDRFELVFFLLNPGPSVLAEYARSNGLTVEEIPFLSKKSALRAFRKVYSLLKKHRIDVVHCHHVFGGLIGLTAARFRGIRKRVYTRHHAAYHHLYHPHAVKYDRFINRQATHLIAISEVVKKVLCQKEGVSESKVHLVHHGFDLNFLRSVPQERIAAVREKYDLNGKPVIGVISRYLEPKGLQHIIPAFHEYLKSQPEALLVLANANGPYKGEVKKLLSLLPTENVREIAFEQDNAALYKCFDVFTHVPVDVDQEAFGQTYIEAMAAGIPSVFTRAGVGDEILQHEFNCLEIPYGNITAITEAWSRLIKDTALRERLIKNAWNTVSPAFEVSTMVRTLEGVYGS